MYKCKTLTLSKSWLRHKDCLQNLNYEPITLWNRFPESIIAQGYIKSKSNWCAIDHLYRSVLQICCRCMRACRCECTVMHGYMYNISHHICIRFYCGLFGCGINIYCRFMPLDTWPQQSTIKWLVISGWTRQMFRNTVLPCHTGYKYII